MCWVREHQHWLAYQCSSCEKKFSAWHESESYTCRCTSNLHVQRVNIPNFANTLTECSSLHQGKSGAKCEQHYWRCMWPEVKGWWGLLDSLLHSTLIGPMHLVFYDSTSLCPTLTMALATCFYSIIDSTLLYHGFNSYSSTWFFESSWHFPKLYTLLALQARRWGVRGGSSEPPFWPPKDFIYTPLNCTF